jgi:hypothetical protein
MKKQRTYIQWSKSDEDRLTELYQTMSNSDLAKLFNVPLSVIKSKAYSLKLKKGDYLEGQVRNHKGEPYVKHEGKWIMLRRYNWLMAGLQIPKGSIVVAINDPSDYSLQNSQLMTRAEAGMKGLKARKGNKVGRKPKPKPEKVRKIKQVKQAPIVKVRQITQPIQRKRVTTYKTRAVDMKDMIRVKVEGKTWIEVRRGASIEEAKMKYYQNHKKTA